MAQIVVPEVQFWEDLIQGLDTEEMAAANPDPLADLHWRDWLARMFPGHVTAAFGKHHAEMWDWAWDVTLTSSPDEFLAIFPRKGGKTSTMQLIVVATILRGSRHYWLYVCETQAQADDKVSNIAMLLGSDTVQAYYPRHAERAINKYGASLGWTRQRLRTAGGGIADALGLNSAARGVLIEGKPPDGIALDDVDGLHDGRRATRKKEKIIMSTVLAAAVPHAMVMVGQNLIIPDGVVSRLSSGKADYMVNRRLAGPLAAVKNLKTERVFDSEIGRHRDIIVSGEPIWEGQDLEACQQYINRYGLTTFIQECQNEVEERIGALWTKQLLNDTRCGVPDLPRDETNRPLFKRCVVGVDPSGGGDEIGIIAAGLGHNGHAYVLRDATQPGPAGPWNWGRATIMVYEELRADVIVAESNFGGDLVKSNILVHSRRANVKMVSASRGKAVRAEPIRALYEDDLIHHVGSFPELEAELTSWIPGESTESPNRLDALVWTLTELMLTETVYTGGAGTLRITGR